MDPEQLLGIASNLARIGCIRAYLPEVPLDTAWARADKQQREMLTAHIQEVPDLWPELESTYWACLGAPAPNCIAQTKTKKERA